jgi:hypothetical protein
VQFSDNHRHHLALTARKGAMDLYYWEMSI